jgi:Poly(hydroxyalcanoate) granule associated protein (phasin)
MATRTAKKPAPTAKRVVKRTVASVKTASKAGKAKVSKTATKATTKATKAVKVEGNLLTANARKMYLAGLGAATRVQDEASKVYSMLATEAQRLTELTSEAAETLAKKAGVYVKEGKKIQNQAVAVAEAKARDTAKEVKAFAKKSEKTLKQNLGQTLNATIANAKQGVTQLEQVFETRVAKTLNTFGIPSSQDVRELQARMSELQKALAQLNKRGVRA